MKRAEMTVADMIQLFFTGAPLHVEAFDRSSFGSEDAQKNKPASVHQA